MPDVEREIRNQEQAIAIDEELMGRMGFSIGEVALSSREITA